MDGTGSLCKNWTLWERFCPSPRADTRAQKGKNSVAGLKLVLESGTFAPFRLHRVDKKSNAESCVSCFANRLRKSPFIAKFK
jgi:hypothetical protein